MIPTEDRKQLLAVARESIRNGLDRGRPPGIDAGDYPESLRVPAATFVTLKDPKGLRGCIGRLEAARPLGEDVAENAFAAAFRDPRFPPLGETEWPELNIHISVLGDPEPLEVDSEEELLAALRPGEDGLIIEEGSRRATFLPSVWESLPDPGDFLRHLKAKAGFPPDYWSRKLRISRYRSENFGDPV